MRKGAVTIILALMIGFVRSFSLSRQTSVPKLTYCNIRSRLVTTYDARLPRTKLNESGNLQKPDKWLKRKVALVIGYVGTKYSGLQMDPLSSLDTIESELEKALHKINCISDANHRLLQKIGWSRSSRTDKGVHCARMVISAKLLLNPIWLENDGVYFDEMVHIINKELPEDIRVFSCTKINGAFHARDACNWREYEYLFPIELLTTTANSTSKNSSTTDSHSSKQWSAIPKTPEEAVNKLNIILKQMEGAHSFHNFHKVSGKNLRSKGRHAKPTTTTTSTPNNIEIMSTIEAIEGSTDNEEENYEDEEEDDEEEEDNRSTSDGMNNVNNKVNAEDVLLKNGIVNIKSDSLDITATTVTTVNTVSIPMTTTTTDSPPSSSTASSSVDAGDSKHFYCMFDPWEKSPRPAHAKTNCNIYSLHASLVHLQQEKEKSKAKATATATAALTTTETALEETIPKEMKLQQMIRVKICGQAFLLNQIRLIVGAAIMVAKGVLPENTIELAMKAQLYVPLPVAPAEGLVLVNAGFGCNPNNQMVYLCSPDIIRNIHTDNNNKNRNSSNLARKNLVVNDSSCVSLLEQHAWEISEEFLSTSIYSRIASDWEIKTETGTETETVSDGDGDVDVDDDTASEKWLKYCERFKVSDAAYEEFSKELSHWRIIREEEDANCRMKDNLLEAFNNSRNNATSNTNTTSTSNNNFDIIGSTPKSKSSTDKKSVPKPMLVAHKRFLPNG
eukprot:gene4828-9627_t